MHCGPEIKLLDLLDAAVEAGLDRRVLLSGLPADIVAMLPSAPSAREQILSDLRTLHRMELSDGTVALRTWLETAQWLSRPRRQASVFEEALAVLKDGRPIESTGAVGAVPGAAVPGAAAPNAPLVYIVGADEDETLVKQLRKHLVPLERNNLLRLYSRKLDRIAGDSVDAWQRAMAIARVVVFLASADAFASAEAIEELRAAVARKGRGEARLIPVLARPVSLAGSPLEGVAIVPRSGAALSSARNLDQALTEIAELVSDAVRGSSPEPETGDERLTRGGHTRPFTAHVEAVAGDRGRSPSPPLSKVPRAAVGTPIGVIFRTSGTPEHTFVEPVEMPRLHGAMVTMGKGLFLEGPSQVGKSSAVARALAGQQHTVVHAWLPAEVERLRGIIAARRFDGHIVVDDAHKLDAGLLDLLCTWVRQMAESPNPTAKVTILGPPGLRNRVITDSHLRSRFDVIPIGRQPKELVLRMIRQGEQAANIEFSHAADIVREAGGSFKVAQEICSQLAMASGVARVEEDPHTIEKECRDVEASVMASLPFRDILHSLLDATGAAAPAMLMVLWTMSKHHDLYTTLFNVEAKNPHLANELRALAGGGLKRAMEANDDRMELFDLQRGAIRAVDPRSEYFLLHLDWLNFAAEASIEARFDEQGHLFVPGQRPDPSGGTGGATAGGPQRPSPAAATALAAADSWLDASVYPVHLKQGAKLRELLMQAYSSVAAAGSLAARVPIRLDTWENGHGIGPAWESLLKLASAQAKLRALVRAVLADGLVEGFHRDVRELTGESTQYESV